MAITYVGVSANVAASTGNLSVTPPATQTDDIMVCAVSSHDNVVLTFPDGWTKYQELDNGVALRSTLAWKRCVGAEAAFTIIHTAGDGIVANVIVFRGCVATGSPINASSMQANTLSSICTAASISTTEADCEIIFTMHDSNNGESSAQTCTDPGALTERFDNASALGTDQAVSGAHANKASIGATGNATGNLKLGPDANNGGLTALKPLVAVIEWLAGVSGGVASASGATAISRKISGIVACVGSVSGASAILKKLTGTTTGVASVSGVTKAIRKIGGTIAGVTSISGIVSIVQGITSKFIKSHYSDKQIISEGDKIISGESEEGKWL